MIHDALKPTDWHPTIAPTRALLQVVEDPLGALWELFAANDIALAALEPMVDVVDFAPFAQLVVKAVEPKPAQVSPAPRRTHVHAAGVPPRPTAGPPSIPASAPTAQGETAVVAVPNLASADVTPVFALPGRKSTAAALPSATSGHATAQVLVSTAQRTANQARASQPMPEAVQIDRVADQPTMTQPVLTQPAPPPVPTVIADGSGKQDVPVETMARLATLTETLLAMPAPNGPVVSGGAQLPGGRSHSLEASRTVQTQSVGPSLTVRALGQGEAPLVAFSDGHADPARVSQSFVPATPSASPPTLVDMLPRTSLDDGWPTASTPIAPASWSQPDGWTLAQLINEVLAAEARRHGVDLS
jgi:hypothetical protein